MLLMIFARHYATGLHIRGYCYYEHYITHVYDADVTLRYAASVIDSHYAICVERYLRC